MTPRMLFALALFFAALPSAARAQDCTPPPIVANAKSSNLFSPEQEMVFGELVVENMAADLRFVRDERLLAYVDAVGQRIARRLPQSGLRYRFHLVDIPEANAFNIPGGHVLLSRKLVASAQNEDELAGVIAHELGHAVVRHSATDISEDLRKILGVKSLGDRRDVTEKYNLLIERARTRRVSRRESHEGEQQLEADRLGLFAMVAAGYDPAAFTSFFDRLTENEGKTGSWLSDFFGRTRPEQKRVREMIRATERLPASCRAGRAARASEDFLKWQAETVSFRGAARPEELPGLLWRRELSPKLRSDVSHFAFSADGRLLLAQDDFSVTVIERDPPRVLFQIPVEGANEAAFTPDGQSVVLTTENLRFERWSVAERKPVEVREMVVRDDCWEHELSPDGNYLACVDTSAAVNVLDTKTGKRVWEKKEFYQLDFLEYLFWLAATSAGDDAEANFFRIQFSPDSRYVMFSRSDQYRFSFRVDGLAVGGSENTALALDLSTLKQADLGGDLKKLSARAYVFLDAGRVLGMPSPKPEDAGVFSFPSGKRLQKFTFASREVKRTASPDHVVVKPLAALKVGVFDLKRSAIVAGMNREDLTLWNNLMAVEAADGKIHFREVSYDEAQKRLDSKEVAQIEIPVAAIGGLDAAEVSDGFNWLLLSSKTRGGLWNLSTGERKIYVRGFKGASVGDDGAAVTDFPRLGDTPHSLVLLNPSNDTVTPVRQLPERGARQYGRFVLLRSSLKQKDKEGADDGPQLLPGNEGADGELALRRDVRFELKDFVRDKVVWSRDFRKEAPEYTFDEFTGRLIFYWRLGSDSGKARLKAAPEMQAKAAALGNKADDYLVEVVDAFEEGKTVGLLLLETGKGSFDVGEGLSEGDWLVLRDSEGRVLVYSIKGGDLRHRFFGTTAAVNPRRSQLAVENFRGEVMLYDLDTGDRQAELRVHGDAALLRYNLAGDKLFVLSDAQTAYAFDLNKLASKATARAQ